MQDITLVKRAEQELKDGGRRKDAFLATLAHELRNPLAPLRVAVDVLRRATSDSAAADKARGMIERQIRQMVRPVDNSPTLVFA